MNVRTVNNDLYGRNILSGVGLGRELIKFVKKYAKDHNIAAVYWLTSIENMQAQIVYDKFATRTSFCIVSCVASVS